MTKENKDLLLKDLCARLPYGVKCRFELAPNAYKTIEFSREVTNDILIDFDEQYCYWFNKGFIIPYLRTMSSMTEEEKKEYNKTKDKIAVQLDNYGTPIGYEYSYTIKTFDYLIAHHFDYRGLIKKGLAIEASKNIYNNNNE